MPALQVCRSKFWVVLVVLIASCSPKKTASSSLPVFVFRKVTGVTGQPRRSHLHRCLPTSLRGDAYRDRRTGGVKTCRR